MKNKKIYIILFITAVTLVVFMINKTKAGLEHNVWGWAWSDNIGWISFNSTDTAGIYSYGVDIDETTGEFSGYAWADSVGWISFNEGDLVGCPISPPDPRCPDGSCKAELNFSTKEVCGWAKVLNDVDGWSGWISLRDDSAPAYGIDINDSVEPSRFEGWAWSDDFGWISFADVNTVLTGNSAPVAAMSCSVVDCKGSGCECNGNWITYNGDGVNYIIVNGSDDDDGLDDIKKSTWTISYSTGGTWSAPIECFGPPLGPDALCDLTIPVPIISAGDYNIDLEVEDAKGLTSSVGPRPLVILDDITADFKCSSDGVNWLTCGTFRINEDEVIYFQVENDHGSEKKAPDRGTYHPINIWDWTFTGVTPDNPTKYYQRDNATSSFQNIGVVELRIVDDILREYIVKYTLPIGLDLPEWEEIVPQ